MTKPLTIYGASLQNSQEENQDLGARRPTFGLFILLALLSLVFWTIIVSVGSSFGSTMLAILILILAIASGVLLIKGQISRAIAIIVYLAVLEPAIRLHAPQLPYLSQEYLIPLWTVIILVSLRKRLNLRPPVLWYGAFLFLELISIYRSESIAFGRTVLVPSISLFLIILVSTQINLRFAELKLILYSYLVGALSIAGLAGRIYLTGDLIQWTTNSNFDASGGMGPNQISFLLGATAFICIFFSIGHSGWRRYIFWVLTAGIIYIMILTFSRGGLYILGIGTAVYFVGLKKPKRHAFILAALMGVFALISFRLAINTTQGIVIERFQEFDAGNRVVLARHGIDIFLNNPVAGVGTGNYYTVVNDQEYIGLASGAHNEWVRAGAELGLPGLLSWSLFAITSFFYVLKGSGAENRSLRLALLFFGLSSMLYNGLKLIVQPFLIFLAFSLISDFDLGSPGSVPNDQQLEPD